jgi:predicted hydrocarbon binding protein
MSESSMKLVGVAIPTLRELRAAVLQSNDPEAAVSALREAGYAGGDAVHAAFEQWLAESGESSGTGDLALAEFGERTTKFFRDAGWGDVIFSPDENEGIAVLDIGNCWEADGNAEGSGCQITTGVLAAFFGKIAGYPVSVLETECSSEGRCQFMLGNAETMQYQWERQQPA